MALDEKALEAACGRVSGRIDTHTVRQIVMAYEAVAYEAARAQPVQRKCTTCDSPSPAMHPAMQCGGEVQPCGDAWHGERHPLAQRPAPEQPRAWTMDLAGEMAFDLPSVEHVEEVYQAGVHAFGSLAPVPAPEAKESARTEMLRRAQDEVVALKAELAEETKQGKRDVELLIETQASEAALQAKYDALAEACMLTGPELDALNASAEPFPSEKSRRIPPLRGALVRILSALKQAEQPKPAAPQVTPGPLVGINGRVAKLEAVAAALGRWLLDSDGPSFEACKGAFRHYLAAK